MHHKTKGMGNGLERDLTLKADRAHPCDYPQTLTDYRHTDNYLRLVMVVVALCCHERTDRQRDGWTGGETDGCYQAHYLPASLLKLRGL